MLAFQGDGAAHLPSMAGNFRTRLLWQQSYAIAFYAK